MSFSSWLAPLRASPRPVARTTIFAHRSLHASSSVLKKKKLNTTEDIFDEAEEDDDLDLFDTTSEPLPVSPSSSTKKSKPNAFDDTSKVISRRKATDKIYHVANLKPEEMRGEAARMRTGTLRKTLEWITPAEGADGLKDTKAIFSSWRYLNKQVSNRTTSSLVAFAIRYQRPELPLEMFSQPLQYGLLKLSNAQLSKLYHAFLSRPASTPFPSPLPSHLYTAESAIWHLTALEHSLSESNLSTEIPSPESTETPVQAEKPKDSSRPSRKAIIAPPPSAPLSEEGQVLDKHVKELLRGNFVAADWKWSPSSDHAKLEEQLEAHKKRLEAKSPEWADAIKTIVKAGKEAEAAGRKPRFYSPVTRQKAIKETRK